MKNSKPLAKYLIASALFIFAFVCSQAQTQVVIRALAKDAKFIGTGIGGALVIVKDHYSQEVLTKGYTSGASGDTKVILTNPKTRYNRITDDNTAKFTASLNIKEPTLVDIEVVAPYNRKTSSIKSATQIWVIPGKDILGDGVILEIPGFVLDILSPRTHEVISFTVNQEKEVSLKVNLVMMCGCAITNDGVWDAKNYEVSAIVRKDGNDVATINVNKAAEENLFEVKVPVKEKGNYELIVTAFDRKAYNTGVDKVNFVVR